jgi:hypothetical protein
MVTEPRSTSSKLGKADGTVGNASMGCPYRKPNPAGT